MCILKNLILLFLILSFLPPCTFSQTVDLPFEHFSVDEGMPTVVNYIYQDKTGFLWFATNSGLYKFDGYSFTSYKHDIDDSTSLIDNTINIIYEDKEGIIWIGTWLGFDKLDCKKNIFKHYKPSLLNDGNGESDPVWAICEDKFGKLWIGTGEGLFTLNKKTQEFIFLKDFSTGKTGLSPNTIGSIHEDKEGAIWIGSNVGLDKFDFKTGKFKHYLNDPGEKDQAWYYSKSIYKINKFLEDDNGTFWLATMGGLVELNPKTGKFNRYLFNPENQTNVIAKISQDVVTGNIWLATWGGLFSFNKRSKEFIHYNTEANCVLSERSGTLWIGTNTDIKKLNRMKQPFRKYTSKYIICAICNWNEKILWMYTANNGWQKFDTKKEQFIPYSYGKGNEVYYFYPGELIIKTEKGGCFSEDTLGNIKPFLPDSLKDYTNNLSWGWKTKKGYWHGTHSGGFYLHNPEPFSLKEIRNFKLEINFIYEDKFGLLWISTTMGKLFCYSPERDSVIEFISGFKNSSRLSGRIIKQIFEDKKGRLWFATMSGLNRFERLTNRLPTGKENFVHYTEKDGLPSNSVLGITEDDHGYLWLNTGKGISRFDPEKKYFKNYDPSYGLDLTTDIFYGFGCKTRNGEMYLPSSYGFTRFHPDSVKDNPFIPTIVITSFKMFDKPYPFSNEIHLPYDENFISFEFAAVSYISPERNQYAYKMEGLDRDWVYSGTRRYASYPNLDPGEYIFRVKGSNNDGVWNEVGYVGFNHYFSPLVENYLCLYLLFIINSKLNLFYLEDAVKENKDRS